VAGHVGAVAVSKKVILDIYCADGSTKESILVDSSMTVGGALKLMAEKSCVDCHVKWGLVERLPELFIDRCLEDDEKLLRIISTWKPQTSNRLIFAQRPEKYDLFRRPERYLLDPYDKASTESVMQSPWDTNTRQALVQRVMDSVNQASTTLLEGPLWLKTEGKKWKKFHFILRDFNLFQTTRSKKGSVHDVHFVASLATVKVYNGIGWKKRYKAPTDFCFALKPPEVQEKKAHIRYLCAENEFIKWGWYSMLRLTLGPPQQLVDNYNAQLGVVAPTPNQVLQAKQVESVGLIRSASITSNGDCSMSSGCVSENDENGFDIDYPDGGTIKRKPTSQPTAHPDHLPLPPPPPLGSQQLAAVAAGEMTPTEMNSLPLPPPPMETTTIMQVEDMVDNAGQSSAIREELYPCGVMRTRFQKIETDDLPNELNQMSLLQQLPSQPPPMPASLMTGGQQQNLQHIRKMNPEASTSSLTSSSDHRRSPRGKVTFSEYVHDVDNCQWQPLKGRPEEDPNAATAAAVAADPNCQRTTEQISYKEKDVSEWVLDSLRHCSSPTGNGQAASAAAPTVQSNSSAADSMRPKLYNGRTVPNCFSPEEIEARLRLQHDLDAVATSRKLPPPPPTRSNGTYLSH